MLIRALADFEYTPGILRAWVEPNVHRKLVNPIRRLLRSKRATFQRVPPGAACRLVEVPDAASDSQPLRFSLHDADEAAAPIVEYDCDYVVLATGGELNPLSDDRLLSDGSIKARRRRLQQQVDSVMTNATSALVVGGGLTGVEMAAELGERMGPDAVTLVVGPTRPERGRFPGDPGAGVLPGFRDTCEPWINLGQGGATRYVRKWLQRRGVKVLEQWAVPPPEGASLANVTAGRRLSCARSWRNGGGEDVTVAWEDAGTEADLAADVVFDCRGLRPNTMQAYTSYDANGKPQLGLYAECVAPSGWLLVDDKFRVAERREREADGDATADAEGGGLVPLYGGRVYCVGDAAEKDKQERTAANAHAEGEYAALDVLRAVDAKPPLPVYVAPPRLCAISLGKWDGIVVLGKWVALRGVLAAVAKMIIQVYFVNFLPLPYWLMRRLPGRLPRRSVDFDDDVSPDVQLARSGGRGLTRQRNSFGVVVEGAPSNRGTAVAVRPAPNLGVAPEPAAEPALALIFGMAAAIGAVALGMRIMGQPARMLFVGAFVP